MKPFAGLLLFICGLNVYAGLKTDGIFCVADRKFLGDKHSFVFRPLGFSLPNAFWLSVISNNIYADGDTVLEEFTRWGFKNNPEPHSEDHLLFIEKTGKAEIEFLGFKFQVPYGDTQAIWAENSEGIILAFRGTEPKKKADIATNIPLIPDPVRTGGSVHMGFMHALKIVWKDINARVIQVRRKDFAAKRAILDRAAVLEGEEQEDLLSELLEWKIPLEGKVNFITAWKRIGENKKLKPEEKYEQWDDLLQFLNVNWVTKQKPIWITGHSLGGGLAQIVASRLLHKNFHVAGLYTYGAPRAGDYAFSNLLEIKANEAGVREQIVRFVNQYDVVARVPPPTGLFTQFEAVDEDWRHVGRLKYFSGKSPASGSVELFTSYREGFDIPAYPIQMRDHEDFWFQDHSATRYIEKLEHIVYGSPANCDRK